MSATGNSFKLGTVNKGSKLTSDALQHPVICWLGQRQVVDVGVISGSKDQS